MIDTIPNLLEREAARIAELMDGASEGRGRCLTVVGPAGIGKTELLRSARALAAANGRRVMSARGGELEREMPYGVARQLLEPVLRAMPDDERDAVLAGAASAARPALGLEFTETPSPTDSFAVLHGLYWLCTSIADQRSAVLFIDDAHWSDAQSLRWIDYLARRVAELPMLLVLAARPAEPGAQNELLETIANEPSASVFSLAPLSPESVGRMVAQELAHADDAFSAACHRATGGNPFLVRELLRAARTDGLEPVAANAEQVCSLGSTAIAYSVLDRLARQGSPPVALAEAVAILGVLHKEFIAHHRRELRGVCQERAQSLLESTRPPRPNRTAGRDRPTGPYGSAGS